MDVVRTGWFPRENTRVHYNVVMNLELGWCIGYLMDEEQSKQGVRPCQISTVRWRNRYDVSKSLKFSYFIVDFSFSNFNHD